MIRWPKNETKLNKTTTTKLQRKENRLLWMRIAAKQ